MAQHFTLHHCLGASGQVFWSADEAFVVHLVGMTPVWNDIGAERP